MRPARHWFALLLSLGLCLGAADEKKEDKVLAKADPAPLADAKLKSANQGRVRLADLRGKVGTLVVFTCNHCRWSQAWEQRWVALANRVMAQGIGVLALNPNDPKRFEEDNLAAMKKRAKQLKMQFPYAVDEGGKLARAYGATRTPEVFLFDGELKLVYRGAIDDNAFEPAKASKHYLRDALQALLAEREVEPADSDVQGCGIRFP